jgi:hypothetical protein
MAVVVQVWEIVDALEVQTDESASFVDRETGKVVTVSTELLGWAEEGEEDPDLLEWQEGEWEMAELIATSGDRFLQLPTKFEVHEWQIMDDFADSQREPLRSDLLTAIRGRGAFRMFKDFLHRRGKIEAWYKYREQALHAIAVEWLKEHDIPFSEAPNPERKR